MPIIQLPVRHTPNTMTLYTNAGVIMLTEYDSSPDSTRHLYSTSYFNNRSIRTGTFTRLNAAEREAVIWTGAKSVYKFCWSEFIVCRFNTPLFLSTRASNIDRIYMMREPMSNYDTLQARIRQSVALRLYTKAVERRTAVAMALHARLGCWSGLSALGGDVLAKILE